MPAPTVVYNAFRWSDRESIDGLSKDRGTADSRLFIGFLRHSATAAGWKILSPHCLCLSTKPRSIYEGNR